MLIQFSPKWMVSKFTTTMCGARDPSVSDRAHSRLARLGGGISGRDWSTHRSGLRLGDRRMMLRRRDSVYFRDFGFSSKRRSRWTRFYRPTVAQLMKDVAGYSRFGAQGGDWGQAVTIQLAAQFPNRSPEFISMARRRALCPRPNSRKKRRLGSVHRTPIADRARLLGEQSRKPQTWPFALSDSPLGTAAWIVEKFKVWSDSDTGIERAFTKDQLLTNVMFYLVTGTPGSAVWIYRGNADEPAAPRGRISVPTGFAAFPKEMPIFLPPRRFLERRLQPRALHPHAAGRPLRVSGAALVVCGRPANIFRGVRS